MLRELQHQLARWRDRNFPDHTWEDQFLGVTEEVGELAHCLLKQKQGIRGTSSEHEINARDAVGDIMIYLMGLCTVRGWDIQYILEETARHIMERDWIADPQLGAGL